MGNEDSRFRSEERGQTFSAARLKSIRLQAEEGAKHSYQNALNVLIQSVRTGDQREHREDLLRELARLWVDATSKGFAFDAEEMVEAMGAANVSNFLDLLSVSADPARDAVTSAAIDLILGAYSACQRQEVRRVLLRQLRGWHMAATKLGIRVDPTKIAACVKGYDAWFPLSPDVEIRDREDEIRKFVTKWVEDFRSEPMKKYAAAKTLCFWEPEEFRYCRSAAAGLLVHLLLADEMVTPELRALLRVVFESGDARGVLSAYVAGQLDREKFQNTFRVVLRVTRSQHEASR